MKNLIFLIFLIFLSLTINSCDSNNDKPKTELEKLPPETQTGANTAGCLVNGVVFLPKGNIPTGKLVCNYIDGKDFSLSIGERVISGSSDVIKDIGFTSQNQNIHSNIGVTYELGQNDNNENSKYGIYSINALPPPSPSYYSTTLIVKGEFKITYHNFNEAILSGTFWFDAINSNGEKVEVRNGRFDMHY